MLPDNYGTQVLRKFLNLQHNSLIAEGVIYHQPSTTTIKIKTLNHNAPSQRLGGSIVRTIWHRKVVHFSLTKGICSKRLTSFMSISAEHQPFNIFDLSLNWVASQLHYFLLRLASSFLSLFPYYRVIKYLHRDAGNEPKRGIPHYPRRKVILNVFISWSQTLLM